MDLLGLPDEMLANICKYNTDNMNVILRSRNSRVNLIVQSFIGTKLHIQSLSCKTNYQKNPDVTNINACLERPIQLATSKQFRKAICFIKKDKPETFLTQLDIILSKVNVKEYLMFDIKQFDDDILDVLLRNRNSLRNTLSLKINSTYYCSSNKLIPLFKSMKRLNRLDINGNNVAAFCNAELLRDRKWESIALNDWNRSQDDQELHGMNDQFMMDVVQNCQQFVAHFDSRTAFMFTIPTILIAFQAALEKKMKPRWLFCFVQRDSLTLEEIKLLFLRIEGLVNFGRNQTALFADTKLHSRISNQWNGKSSLHAH